MKTIYLDNASTTRTRKEVIKEMSKYFNERYGNPSSFHSKGLEAKTALENSRKKVAKIINAKPNEVIFTGSGTESINLAIQGVVRANPGKKHIITSTIEHHAVLGTCKYLEELGYEITKIGIDRYGVVNPENIRKTIRSDTLLVTIMFANNEIGSVNEIEKIGEICKEKGVYFHTDACQAGPYIKIDVKKLNVDLLTLNGSKIYGPKGVGILYVKEGVKIKPIIYGGEQESGLRSGTENVAGIVGFAKALELVDRNREKENKRLIRLRDRLMKGLLRIPKTILNGHPTKRLPNNVSVAFLDVEGESVILRLDKYGIYASTGSACSSKSLEPSHVILGLGKEEEIAHCTIRFTLGKETTERDIDYTLKIVPKVVSSLREISPVKMERK